MLRRNKSDENGERGYPSSKKERLLCVSRWLPGKNRLLTLAIILYVAFTQATMYRSKHIDSSFWSRTMIENRIYDADCQTRKSGFPPKVDEVDVHPEIWKPFSIQATKLPYPIFVTSLPKSGTTSIWKFFKCGGQLSSHNWIQRNGQTKSTLVGKCIEDNIRLGIPPFRDCGDVDVYSDTGYLVYDHDNGQQCYYPSIDGLNAIYASYPTATFVNVVRDTKSWYDSLKAWSHSSLFIRFRLCNATGFPNGQSNKQGFLDFYNWHNDMIRKFVRDHPSLTYVEVNLESEETGEILEKETGIDAACWKKCKPEERHCENDHV